MSWLWAVAGGHQLEYKTIIDRLQWCVSLCEKVVIMVMVE